MTCTKLNRLVRISFPYTSSWPPVLVQHTLTQHNFKCAGLTAHGGRVGEEEDPLVGEQEVIGSGQPRIFYLELALEFEQPCVLASFHLAQFQRREIHRTTHHGVHGPLGRIVCKAQACVCNRGYKTSLLSFIVAAVEISRRG